MYFYKIEATRQIDRSKEIDRQDIKVLAEELQERSVNYYQNSDFQCVIFAANISSRNANCNFGIIACAEIDVEALIKEYFSELPFEIEKYTVKETTFSDVRLLIRNAERSGCMCDVGEVLSRFGIGDMAGICFHESLVEENHTFDEICKDAENILFDETLIPEFKRIYTPPTKKIKGHPVHYLIHGKDIKNNCKICDNLLSALYQNGRISCKRIALIYTSEIDGVPIQKLNSLYKLFDGGAIVVCHESEEDNDDMFKMGNDEIIEKIGELANRYKNKVLTIINLENASNKIKENFYLNCSECTFVELHEGLAYGEKAINLLKKLAEENEIETDDKLISSIEDKGYDVKDLNRIFDNWYSNKLKNDIYPQYKTSETNAEVIKNEAPQGSAYERLNNLIGITEAKKTMNNILDYFKAQKVLANRGIITEQPSMHMVFTGNPGTAKTTVARLFAQIMKENDLLFNGNILEVGRADIVGKYVGSTAPLVKKAFQKAKGGVLFIDEAYSLVDGKDGLFGDEAINTIVQEMENNRSDTVVIFAGYPDKMESFLNKNPGLRSRIAFHVNFDDYNSEDLLKIFEFIAMEKGMNVSTDAREKLLAIFDDARKNSDFGNGRYARNIFEKVKMTQASRLMKMKLEDITDDNLKNIHAEDIEMPGFGKNKAQKVIGF